MCRGHVAKGDVDSGFAQAVENCRPVRSVTGFIEHAYIEPEAGYALRQNDTLILHGCTQAPYMNREAIASMLALDPSQVVIKPSAVGGGFGSKLDLSWQPYVALAAWAAATSGAYHLLACRVDAVDDQASSCEHARAYRFAMQKGMSTAMQFDGVFNTGAYASWGTGPWLTGCRCMPPGLIVYRTIWPTPPGCIHIAVLPGHFEALVCPRPRLHRRVLYDELAQRLGIDRLAFRLKNALGNGVPTVTGQVFHQSVGIRECLQALEGDWQAALDDAARVNAEAVEQHSPVRRGVGIGTGWYGCGNTSMANPSTIRAGITADGRVCLHQGAVDIGQGSNTVIVQIFADSLGVPVDALTLVAADTDITPDAGKTSASRQTFISGNAARLAGLSLRAQVMRLSNGDEDSRIDFQGARVLVNAASGTQREIDLAGLPVDESGYVIHACESYDPPTKALDENGQGDPYALYGYAAHLVVLDVDTDLGTVVLRRIVAAHDVGRAINPQLVDGQIHGGVAQGVGLALMEEFIPGRTENLHDYLIPTIGDIPPIDTRIVEVSDPHGPFGAKGLGEHVLIPTAPAILGAIRHATGIAMQDVPVTPARLRDALREADGSSR